MRRIVADEEYCMNCRLCEIHCLVSHSKTKNIIKAFRQERGKVVPRITVEKSGPVSLAVQCRHCEEAECATACMTGAISRNPVTNEIVHDPDKCVGCWMCIMVCPTGAIRRDSHGHVAAKCDFCAESGEPACVANCPNEALRIEEY